MIVASVLLTIVALSIVLLVSWIRWINRSYKFGLALDRAEGIEARHYIELEQKSLLASLEAERDKTVVKREEIKASIRKEGLDPERPIF